MDNQPKVKQTIYLTKEMKHKVKVFAADNDKTLSQLFTEMLEQLLQQDVAKNPVDPRKRAGASG